MTVKFKIPEEESTDPVIELSLVLASDGAVVVAGRADGAYKYLIAFQPDGTFKRYGGATLPGLSTGLDGRIQESPAW